MGKNDPAAPSQDTELLRAFARLPEVLSQTPQDPADPTGKGRLAKAYARLEKDAGLVAGCLNEKFPSLTTWLLGHHDLDQLVKCL